MDEGDDEIGEGEGLEPLVADEGFMWGVRVGEDDAQGGELFGCDGTGGAEFAVGL